jgi:Flp pilus assembly protein TadG
MIRRPFTPRRRHAATLVEVTLVAIVFFMLLFGIFEFGQLVMVNNIMDNAVREGARYAAVNTNQGSSLAANVQNVVVSRLGGAQSRLSGFNAATAIVVTTVDQNGNQVNDSSNNPVPPQSATFGQYVVLPLSH